MIRRTIAAGCAAVAAAALASPALAATDLGQTTATSSGCGGPNQLAWQTSAPYLVPGKGVITQLRVSAGTAGATMSIKIVRPSTTSVVYTTAPQTVVNANDVVTVDVRVPVEAGDALGFWLGSDAIGCMTPTGPSDTYAGVSGSPDQPAGPIAGSLSTGAGGRLAIGGRFEADADGDGYGDDSQDGCPTDSSIHDGGCVGDAGVTATATPAKIELGDIAVVDMSATNPGPATLRGVSLTAVVPSGLTAVVASPRTCPLAAAFSCALGDFGAGSREAVLVVRGDKAGTYAVPVSVASTGTDANPANNLVSVPVTVTPNQPRACRVPSLKGRTKALASALANAAGCKLGKAKVKKIKKGRAGVVSAQKPKAGAIVPLKTAVAVTVTRRAR